MLRYEFSAQMFDFHVLVSISLSLSLCPTEEGASVVRVLRYFIGDIETKNRKGALQINDGGT